MSVDPSLALVRGPVPADLQKARQDIKWVGDDDLRSVKKKDPTEAAVLSVFLGGGGHIYIGEYLKGAGLIVASIAAFAIGNAISGGVGTFAWLTVGAIAAFFSFKKAKAVNRFVSLRDDLDQRRRLADGNRRNTPPGLPAYNVHGVPQTAQPSRYVELIARIRKLGALYQQGMMSDVEFKDRKIDLITGLGTLSRHDLDDLLFELIPLHNEGLLTDDDIAFIKTLDTA